MSIPPISIRSALFALKKLNLVSEVEFKKLDRNWIRYRNEHDLNAYGVSNQIDVDKSVHSNYTSH